MKSIIPQKPFYFIRHGETDWNPSMIPMGLQDNPLNETGVLQAQEAAEALKNEPITHIVTSPLSRTMKTAEIIAAVIQKPITAIDELKECSYGIKEGQPVDIDAVVLLERWRNGEGSEGVETIHEFDIRVVAGVVKALESPGVVLIVAHGGVYRSLTKALGLPTGKIKNCEVFYHKPQEDAGQPWEVSHVGDIAQIHHELATSSSVDHTTAVETETDDVDLMASPAVAPSD